MPDESIERRHKTPYKRCIHLVFIFSISLFGISQAGDTGESIDKSKFLGIILGSGGASYREDLLVPLGFGGPGFTLGAHYTRISQNRDIDIRLKIGAAFLENRFSHKAYAATLDIRSFWIKRLFDNRRYGGLWAGICLPIKMNNLLLESWDDAHLYWLTSYSLGPAAEWRRNLSPRYRAGLHIEIPFVSLVSRPREYRYRKQEALNHWTYHFSEPNKFLRLRFPDKFRAVFVRLSLSRIMNNALFNLGLEFEYNYSNEPRNIYVLNTALMISYQWRTGL